MMKKFAVCASLVLVRITRKLNFKGVFLRNTLFLFEIFEILWYNISIKMRGEKKK